MKPVLVEKLKMQAEMVMNASQKMLALSLWAKKMGWKGAHEWIGDFSLDLRSHVKNINKFLLDYAQVPASVPATEDCPCSARNYPDLWQMVREAVVAEQEGWRSIGATAEDEGETDVDTYAEGFMDHGITMVKKLNRWINELDQGGDDRAYWKLFDKKRSR